MKAVVDKETCTGCELCTQTCPEVFQMKDNKAEAHANPVPQGTEETCKKAAEECPVNAIKVE